MAKRSDQIPENDQPPKLDDIDIMRRCVDLINQVDIVARARVVSYLHTKYMNEALEEARRRGVIKDGVPKAPAAPNGNG